MRQQRMARWLVAVAVVAGLGATDRETVLLDAVKAGDVRGVRALMQQRVSPNAAEVDGTTALIWAVQQEHAEIAELLLQAGADATRANRYGMSPLFVAAANGNAGLLTRLMKAGANPNATREGGETPLMVAARNGNPDAVRALLARGADVRATESRRGQTALMGAVTEGNAEAVKALIQAGADVNMRSRGPATKPLEAAEGTRSGYTRRGRFDAYTPLLMAARRGHIEVARALLAGGANIHDTAPNGASVLVVAAANAHWELGVLLLERGANPNAMGQGWNALHQVARTRGLGFTRLAHPPPTGSLSSLDFAKAVLKHGVDINAKATRDWGRSDNQRGRFSEVGASALLMAAKSADVELMRLLLAAGADPKIRNRDGTTMLMAAAGCDVSYVGEDSRPAEESLEAVKIALAAGADVNERNTVGDTALHGAAFTGANIVVQHLVDQGGRLDATNKWGQSPLAVAVVDYQGAIDQFHPETAAFIRTLLAARGMPEGKVFTPEELRKMYIETGERGIGNDIGTGERRRGDDQENVGTSIRKN